MNIDAGRGAIDEGKRPRRTLDRLTPAGKPEQAEERHAQSPSRKFVDQSKPTARNVSRGPKKKAKEAVRGTPSLPAWLRRLGYYGLALLFVAIAALLRWAFSDVLSPTPFLVFYLAWVGAAAFGGLGPGLLATLASWVCVDLLFDTTPGRVGFTDPTSVGRLLVLLAGGLAVSLVAEQMRRGRIHERRQGRELAELARSLAREKGILQSVMKGAKNSHLVYLDRDFNFVRVNETYAKTCGYTPEEMVGKDHFVLYPHAENEAIFCRVRDTGVPVEIHEKPFVFPDQPERGVTYWD
jgi:PAS domain S-box-containing protein